jgi:manganese-dependent inorganic pyrophosphatase
VKPVYVTGHRNPDTDSIGSAIGLAELKNRMDPENEYIPVRLGELNPQTTWVLKRAGVRPPQLLSHAMLRAMDVMSTDFPCIKEDDPVREAGLAMSRADAELIPVVNDDGVLTGVVTTTSPSLAATSASPGRAPSCVRPPSCMRSPECWRASC